MPLIRGKRKIKKLLSTTFDLTYDTFMKNNVILKTYKVPQLKAIAKQYRLLITGNKGTIIERIENMFLSIKSAILIQKIFRGNIVRLFLRLRGPAKKDRSICVNETDGYTLEPLNEIPLERFYSYCDSKDFIYGFDLMSLLEFYKNKVKIINPYTRERLNNTILNQILSLGRITKILCPDIFKEYQKENEHPAPPLPPTQNHVVILGRNNNNVNNAQLMIINRLRILIQENTDRYNEEQIVMINKLYEIKNRPIQTRISDLFIEIDLLGNYTQSQWFSQLDKGQYIRYLRLLYNYWNYRGQIPQETRSRICPFFDPFLNIILPYLNYNEICREQIQEACTCIMENMIYCGLDDEYRKLGALYVLSILTVVSIPARNSMYWLYDSLDY